MNLNQDVFEENLKLIPLRLDVPFTSSERAHFKEFVNSRGLKEGRWARAVFLKAMAEQESRDIHE